MTRRTSTAAVAGVAAAACAFAVAITARGGAAAPAACAPPAGLAEPLAARTALAAASPPTRLLATFAQLTDAHVTDEESPARLEPLDQIGPPYTSAFRPQESLTGQVLAGAVRALDRLPLQAVVETGDLVDNDQRNELDEALAVLRGGRADPSSGSPAYEGVQAATEADRAYYRPDLDQPLHPGLLAAAQQPFESPGLRARWYPVLGNHDILVEGLLPPSAATERIAVGDRKLVSLSATALALARTAHFDPSAIGAALASGLPGPSVRVTPDPQRRELTSAQAIAALRTASGLHGGGRYLDYTFDLGRSLRAIVLDVVDRAGGQDGHIHPGQAAWLAKALRAAGSRRVLVFSHMPLPQVGGGAALLALLDRDPRVLAAIAGHTHRNSIAPRRSAAGGYWLITTASLVDYPQQARVFRLCATQAGGVVLQTWTVSPDRSDPLVATSEQLALLDRAKARSTTSAGKPGDRDASLYR